MDFIYYIIISAWPCLAQLGPAWPSLAQLGPAIIQMAWNCCYTYEINRICFIMNHFLLSVTFVQNLLDNFTLLQWNAILDTKIRCSRSPYQWYITQVYYLYVFSKIRKHIVFSICLLGGVLGILFQYLKYYIFIDECYFIFAFQLQFFKMHF